MEPPLLSSVLPTLAVEIHDFLVKRGKPELASHVPSLRLVDHCRCGEDFCSLFYVMPKPKGAYGPVHWTLDLQPELGMMLIDIVGEILAAAEVLYRDEVREAIKTVLP